MGARRGGASWVKIADEALVPYATTAPDGSFTSARLTIKGQPLTLTYGLVDDSTVGVVLRPEAEMEVELQWLQRFTNCKTVYWVEDGNLCGLGIDANTCRSYPLQVRSVPQMTIEGDDFAREKTTRVTASPSQPAVLMITVGHDPSMLTAAEVINRIEKASEKIEKC